MRFLCCRVHRLILTIAIVTGCLRAAGVTYAGHSGPGKGKHIVMLAGDDEYHSEEALPALAKDLDCTSWAQLFLKFIIGHPAVTCPIPATSNPAHIADNVQAAFGRIPDDKQRKQMAALV